MFQIHFIKTLPEYYAAVVDGTKTFELRKNDRDYKVGDALVLQEFHRETGYTGEMITVAVTFLTNYPAGLREGFVAMGIKLFEGAQ